MMGVPEVFSSSPNLLDFIDIQLQEVSRCDHLLKETGEIMGSSWSKVGWSVSKYICLVTWTRLVSKQKASFFKPHEELPLFLLPMSRFFGRSTGPVASSMDEQCCHLGVGVANYITLHYVYLI